MERRAADTVELRGALGGEARKAVEAARSTLFAGFLATQVLAFAAVAASGNIPRAVLVLFRALLTL